MAAIDDSYKSIRFFERERERERERGDSVLVKHTGLSAVHLWLLGMVSVSHLLDMWCFVLRKK